MQNNMNVMTNKQKLLNRYEAARKDLLFVALFTAINVILQVVNAGMYFLFSATIPYSIVDFARYYCGMYPAEFYDASWNGVEFLPKAVLYVAVAISLVIVALYLVCYFCSKKQRVGWLIAALVMFAADTAAMFVLYPIDFSIALDLIFHVLVIAVLTSGVMAYYSLKKLPEKKSLFSEGDEPDENAQLEENGEDSEENVVANANLIDSPIIRRADMSVNHRVLAEAELFGHKVVYRRVKKTNELVIDSNVYAEYTALLERDHMLTADLDGHSFAAGLEMGSVSYIMVDGREAVKKMRLI